MKKYKFTLLTLLLLAGHTWAQQAVKINQSSGKLILQNITNVSIEGYDGKEITITRASKNVAITDPRAAGLSNLGESGFDNTGMGISLSQKDNIAYLAASGNDESNQLIIKLPYAIALTINSDRYGWENDSSKVIQLKNLQSETNINSRFNHIKLDNIKGPLSIKTVSGNIEGSISRELKGPILIVTVDGLIDLSISEQSKLNLAISNLSGSLYADKALNFEPMKQNPRVTSVNSLLADRMVMGYNINLAKDSDSLKTANSKQLQAKVVTGKTGKTSEKSIDAKKPKVGAFNEVLAEKIVNGKSTKINGNIAIPPTPPSPLLTEVNVTGFAIGSRFNGTVNGGGEKIILKSTAGNIYIRKW